MRGNKFENSYFKILEPETLSRESRVTESAQEIVDSTPYNCGCYTYVFQMSTLLNSWCWGLFYKNWGFYLEGCLTVKN